MGSEDALIDIARKGDSSKNATLFYFWSPHGLLGDLDLSRVLLPGEVGR